MKLTRVVTISNDLGLHLRAAGVLAQIAGQFASEITLARTGTVANAKSIMSILALAAAKGTELEITADGDDADVAVEAIQGLIARGFTT